MQTLPKQAPNPERAIAWINPACDGVDRGEKAH